MLLDIIFAHFKRNLRMSKRNKLEKFEQMAHFENVRECPDPTRPELYHNHQPSENLRGKWRTEFFKNKRGIIMELACGKGDYTLALAENDIRSNYIGVDVKGARLWRGALTAIEKGWAHVGFLRTRIEVLETFFEENEIDEIWITFPDPFYKKERRRLSHPQFLEKYQKMIHAQGILHIKTDDLVFYEYSIEQIKKHPTFEIIYKNANIYESNEYPDYLNIKTFYEKKHLAKNKTIKYIKAINNKNKI